MFRLKLLWSFAISRRSLFPSRGLQGLPRFASSHSSKPRDSPKRFSDPSFKRKAPKSKDISSKEQPQKRSSPSQSAAYPHNLAHHVQRVVRLLGDLRHHVSPSQVWWIAKYTFIFATLAMFCTHRILSLRSVSGPSMLPTMNWQGDTVLICMLYPSLFPVRAGDLVTFESPMRAGERSIKRIIGMPGDIVLRDTPPGSSDNFWIEADPERHAAQNLAGNPGWMVRIPEGHCWVVGDDLPWSRDSRHFGPLPLALVKGRVLARTRPLRQFTWYHRNEAFEDIE